MNTQNIMNDFSSLPPAAQQQVADFIVFLKQRYQADQRANKQKTALANEPFIGLWRDRIDLEDSSKWVHDLRISEWG
ncbi:MAG TPA: DUF2281 domain-containing protein [Thiolinea sp.]|nr:DUF2281 domain-containing protein [Thiolinea sp.]